MKEMTRILATLAAIMMFAPTVWAQEAPKDSSATDADVSDEISDDSEVEDATYRETKNWSVNASLGTSIGQGTFVTTSQDTQYEGILADSSNSFDRWNMSWNAGGAYTFLNDYTASVSLAGVQWLTDGGGLNDSGEHRFQDIGAYVQWSGFTIDAINTSISSDVSFVFPTSDLSRYSNLVVSTGLGVGAAFTGIPGVTLTYNISGGKDFHTSKTASVDPDKVGQDNVLFREGPSERLSNGLVNVEGVNTEWSLANSFGASIGIWDTLRFSVSYSLTTFWSYDRDNIDEFTSPLADGGRGVGQLQRGSLTLSYNFTDWAHALGLSSLSVNTGLRTATSPLTADQGSVNFPFWNTNGAASNRSSIRFGLGASY